MDPKFVLNCLSEEWKAGYNIGFYGFSDPCPYEKGTQEHYNWVDGWITGNSERFDSIMEDAP